MAHYKVKGQSRLSTRTSETDRAWLKVCAQIGKLVNDWSYRSDLAVYGGEMTTLTDPADETARAAIISASTTMQTDIQNATDVATLQSYMSTMNA